MSRVEQTPGNEDPAVHKEPLMVHGESIPTLLKEYPQWVCWRYVYQKEGRPLKVPVNPRNLHNAGVKWPNTWGTFPQAFAAYQENSLDGLGFVLTRDDGFVGVDLDSCVSKEGLTEPAIEAIQLLQSYAEVSPSARGVRILATSDYQENHKSKSLEIYSHSRFVTITGHRIEHAPADIVNVGPSVLQSLLPRQSPPATSLQYEAQPFQGSDMEFWEYIFQHDHFGDQHRARFSGITAVDHGDASLSMIRLLNALAWHTGGDASRIRRMVLMSSLVTDKWFSRRGKRDYLDYQIHNAINYVKGGK